MSDYKIPPTRTAYLMEANAATPQFRPMPDARTEEIKRMIFDRIDESATARLIGGPIVITDADHRMIGEAAARRVAEDPSVASATYDHDSRTVNVTLTGEAMGFPCAVVLGGDER